MNEYRVYCGRCRCNPIVLTYYGYNERSVEKQAKADGHYVQKVKFRRYIATFAGEQS